MSIRKSVLFMVSITVAASSGCATSGPAFTPTSEVPSDKALVYIYRPAAFAGSAIHYTVHAEDEPIVKLKPGGYYAYLAQPGQVEFWAKTEAKSSAVESLRSGETYYLKGGIGMGFIVGHPRLSFVDKSTGHTEVKQCKRLPGYSATTTKRQKKVGQR
jgi:hypothetical protein